MHHTATNITPTMARRISLAAWTMAAFGTVAGELHALARINSHPDDLAYPLTRAWAVPAMDAMRPLLDWSDPYFVYWTYGKIWLPVCLAFAAAAYLVYRRRQPKGAEKWAWRVQLAAYAILTLSVAGDYYTPWTDQFFGAGLVAFALIALGGAVLGIMLVRSGFRPRTYGLAADRVPAVLLRDHGVTSMGNALLPLMWGWALAALRLSSGATPVAVRRGRYRPERERLRLPSTEHLVAVGGDREVDGLVAELQALELNGAFGNWLWGDAKGVVGAGADAGQAGEDGFGAGEAGWPSTTACCSRPAVVRRINGRRPASRRCCGSSGSNCWW